MRFKSVKYAILWLIVVGMLVFVFYRKMSQAEGYLATEEMVKDLRFRLALIGEKPVASDLFEKIRCGATRMRVGKKILVGEFFAHMQIEADEKFFKDSEGRNIYIVPCDIDISSTAISIYFVMISEPFLFCTFSLHELKFFSYESVKVKGYICFSEKE